MYGLKRVKHRRDDALARTDWAEVERLLAAHYRLEGYDVQHCGTGATGAEFDGGVDLRLRRGEEVILVQCKHWNAMKVPHNDVHQLIGVMVNESATGAILVTSGEFTKAAIEAATRQGHVQLVDGDELRGMLGPLPEPARVAGSDFKQEAIRLSSHVGERLVVAAEARIRGEARERAGKTVGTALKIVLIKAALGLALVFGAMIAAVMLFNHAMDSLQGMATAHKPPSAPVVSSAAHNPAPVEVHEIDVAPPVPPALREPTPAEVREQQRKADEAMKVIEATTPEV